MLAEIRRLVVRMAALLHDVGKPKTRSIGAKGVSFHHHEVVGARMARERLKALRFPNDQIEAITQLVYLHLRFHGYSDEVWSDAAVRRYVRDAGDLLDELNELTRCDCTTRNARKAKLLSERMDALEERIAELLARKAQPLALSLLTEEGTADREIPSSEAASPGLVLAGYTERFVHSRVQVLGETEITFLEALPEPERTSAMRRFLDFDRPIGLLLFAILHHIGDDEDPRSVAAALIDALPSGSYVAISHFRDPGERDPEGSRKAREVERVFNESLGTDEADLLRRVNIALDGRLRQPAYGRLAKRRVEEVERAGWTIHGDLADLVPTAHAEVADVEARRRAQKETRIED